MTLHEIVGRLQEMLPEGAEVFVDVQDGEVALWTGCRLSADAGPERLEAIQDRNEF